MVVQRHLPILAHLRRFGVDPDVMDSLLDLEVRRFELRDLVDPGPRIGADPRHPPPRLGVFRRYSWPGRRHGRFEDHVGLLFREALLALLLSLSDPDRHFLRDVYRYLPLLLGVVERGLDGRDVRIPDRLRIQELFRLLRQLVFLRLALLGYEQLVLPGDHFFRRQAGEVVMTDERDQRFDFGFPRFPRLAVELSLVGIFFEHIYRRDLAVALQNFRRREAAGVRIVRVVERRVPDELLGRLQLGADELLDEHVERFARKPVALLL